MDSLQTRPTAGNRHGPMRSGRWRFALPAAEAEPDSGDRTEDAFKTMISAYRATGGAARGDDLARLLEYLDLGDYVSLARRIVSGNVFGFHWHDTLWVPMFQFNLHDLSIRPGPQQVVAELAPVFAGWDMAWWFARPNVWLEEQRPIDLLTIDLASVREAARTDRFIATG